MNNFEKVKSLNFDGMVKFLYNLINGYYNLALNIKNKECIDKECIDKEDIEKLLLEQATFYKWIKNG